MLLNDKPQLTFHSRQTIANTEIFCFPSIKIQRLEDSFFILTLAYITTAFHEENL